MFTWIKNLFGIKRSGGGVVFEGPLEDWLKPKTASGERVTAESIWSIPAFRHGVDLVSSGVAAGKTHVYRRGPNNARERDREHPADKLLNRRANANLTPFAFKRGLIRNAVAHGNGYAYIAKNEKAEPIGLHLLRPENVVPSVIEGIEPEIVYGVWVDGKWQFVESHNILHIKNVQDCTGLIGMDVISQCRQVLGHAQAQMTYSSTYLKNSGGAMTIVRIPEVFPTPEDKKKYMEGLKAYHSGALNAHQFLCLDGGADASRLQVSNSEAQFIEGRAFSIIEIGNILSISAFSKLGSQINTSYASLEWENEALLRDTLRPYVISFDQESSSKLLRESEQDDGYYIETDRDSLVTLDKPSETNVWVTKLNNGLCSWEEYRAATNQSTERDENQEWRVPANITILGDEPEPAPAPEPPQPDLPTPEPEPEIRTSDVEPEAARGIVRAAVDRLITRLQNDADVYPAKHKDVFAAALPNCERSLSNFWDQLESELEMCVGSDQRKSVVQSIDREKLYGEIWNDISQTSQSAA